MPTPPQGPLYLVVWSYYTPLTALSWPMVFAMPQVESAAAAAKVNLPADMLETAKSLGLRSTALTKYLALQVSTRSRLAFCQLIEAEEALIVCWDPCCD